MHFTTFKIAAVSVLCVVSAASGGAAVAQSTDQVGQPLNAFRAAEGRAAFRQNAKADAAALAHARDMAQQGFFAHTGSNGSTLGRRLRAAGCRFTGAAENIAKGQPTAAAVVAAWADSQGHRTNMLGAYDQYGAAQVGDIWVLVLASGC